MGRRTNTTKSGRRQQASKRSRYIEDRLDLDMLVRYAAQRDSERVWR